MSWRGCGGKDAPEHIIMGDINEQLLETSGMEYAVLDEDNSDQVLTTALKKIKGERLPYTLLVKKGLFDERH
jgi:sulfopyruvate decarboxylase TPP-binding subunit